MTKLCVLDLFSGIGGFSLGLERTGHFDTAAFCEIEPFPRAVLKKHWPDVPCFEDIRKLKGTDIDRPIGVICGGYPCQPFSHAGKREGTEDDRHLWPEMFRLVQELRPTWVIGENVAGHISMGLDEVLSDLETEGYSCRSFVIPACAKDAPHRRDRVWTIAHAELTRGGGNGGRPDRGQPKTKQQDIQQKDGQALAGDTGQICGSMADPSHAGLQGRQETRSFGSIRAGGNEQPERCSDGKDGGTWLPEPNVGRVANGVPNRVDRLKALGNAVVPQITEMIGYAIAEAEGLTK